MTSSCVDLSGTIARSACMSIIRKGRPRLSSGAMTSLPRIVILLLFMAFPVTVADAQAQDPVHIGYQQFYAGDTNGAQQQFAKLLAVRPDDLAARFGDLMVLDYRTNIDAGLEAEFERKIDTFLGDAARRHSRSATDDDALFHLAIGHLLRAQYRLRNDKGVFAAARDGANVKRYAEAYIKRRPEHGDAYLPLGVYNYFMELAPAFFKVIRTFLFLPGGNRAEGLKQIERAYRDGSHFSFVAGLTLAEIYGTFEARADEGVVVGKRLAGQYPDNPAPQLLLAGLHLSPAIEDHATAAAQFQAVIEREDRRNEPRLAKYEARMGLASARFGQWRLAEAAAVLTEIIDANPFRFRGVMPNALLRRANFRALLDDPAAGEDARRVKENVAWRDFHEDADEQLSWIGRRRKSGESAVYAALIPANGLAAAKQWDEAAAAYERFRQQHPNDVQVKFRIGHLALLRGDVERAVRDLTPLVEHRSSPSWLKAQALLHVARAHDIRGRRAEAKRVYERIVDEYGSESAALAARLGLITPYQKRPSG